LAAGGAYRGQADFDGQPRPAGTAADIGAFEFASDSTPLPAPTNLRVIKITP